jgi:competence protein ComEC
MHHRILAFGVSAVLAVSFLGCAPRSAPPTSAPARTERIAMALDVDPSDVYVRIVDVGPALCAVIQIPGGHSMVYDAGHWNGQHCSAAVRELVTGDTIDLMVISHSDADHLGDAARILGEKHVRQTILAGEPRDTISWSSLIDALAEEVKDCSSVLNLQSVPLVPGTRIPLGEAVVTLVAGWPVWNDPGPTASERRNAISVVVRLEYRGRSVLFTGDTVGRRLTDPDSGCKDAEKVMVDRHNAGQVSLKSDVVIASHHGGNNGSASCFIAAIDPQFVVFSAGHDHQHPTHNAATRFLTQGLAASRLFRTDFGDDESGTFEWKLGSITGCSDPAGDDDVEIALRAGGTVEVDYLRTPTGCDSRSGL